jgi:hypothetical protein
VPRLYDRIGHDYARERRADPRIAARVMAALGDARTVVNVGAGAGAYEPRDRWVLAVEPSGAMRAQRPAAAAPCLAAGAEALPLDGSVQVEAVAISHDCRDGFVHAFWRRPQLLLDSSVRASMAVFARLDPTTVERGLGQLAGDVDSGEWGRRHSELLERSELDLGHRLVVWRPSLPAGGVSRW